MNEKELIEWAEFVATKFQTSRDGWIYSRDLGDLKHLRYESDYTGYNHWLKRLKRGFNWSHLSGSDRFARSLRQKDNLKSKALHAWAWLQVSLRKDDNLPDGQINGILTNWEEDGEYIAIFQPRVGVKVLDFLKAEPENPYAKAILAEMQACVALSWPDEEEDTENIEPLEETVDTQIEVEEKRLNGLLALANDKRAKEIKKSKASKNIKSVEQSTTEKRIRQL